ncbi:tRNA (guanine-N(1)-)-methyltransferase [bioreactor metagenome]|uniref:tRNA (guanine-N(1)-)-methyltransferase n=1 Tax=bioreactor metagenome TaxID=1076179 RepID=A0A645INF2_9ZZZZ
MLLSPRGKLLTPSLAQELAKEERLVLLCGHYEGVDERVMTLVDEEISIGDYVLTGGELPAMVLIDCVSRFVPGVLGSGESAEGESFSQQLDGLLEYPQYTRPAQYEGLEVPEVLLSGNHAHIERWRREQSLKKTLLMRPDLLEKAALTQKDKEYLALLDRENPCNDQNAVL